MPQCKRSPHAFLLIVVCVKEILAFDTLNAAAVKRVITTKPFAGSTVQLRDAESLAYMRDHDVFWTGDDDGDALWCFKRLSGLYAGKVPSSYFLQNFAGLDSAYTVELEIVVADPLHNHLLVFNTVNTPGIDLPALYIMESGDTPGTLKAISWQPLSTSFKWQRAVIIDSQLYVSDTRKITAFDPDKRVFPDTSASGEPRAVYSLASGYIGGLSYYGGVLWILTSDYHLIEFDWKKKMVKVTHDIHQIVPGNPKGVECVDNEAFLVDGDAPNNIFVIAIGFSTAAQKKVGSPSSMIPSCHTYLNLLGQRMSLLPPIRPAMPLIDVSQGAARIVNNLHH